MPYTFISVRPACSSALTAPLANSSHEAKIACKSPFFGYFFSKASTCVCVSSGVLLLAVPNLATSFYIWIPFIKGINDNVAAFHWSKSANPYDGDISLSIQIFR